MDRPDTILELRRDVVQDEAGGFYQGDDYSEAVSGTGFTAQATVHLSLTRVWFIFDSVDSLTSQTPYLRLWQEEETAGVSRDPLRHFAITLSLKDPVSLEDSKIEIETIACIPLVQLPPRTVTIPNGPRAGESREIAFNELPLLGSLTVHDHLEVRDAPEGGAKTIVLDLNPQEASVLIATRAADGNDSRLYGTAPERRADGSIAFGGQDPKVTWDLDYAEAYWITHSIAGDLLTAFERVQNPGMSDAEARIAVLDLIAEQLTDAVRPKLLELGTDGVADLLGESGHLKVDPDAEDDSTYKDLDVIVHRYGPATAPQESMVAQLKTIRELPPGEDLPVSILAERIEEPIGLAVTGFSVLLSVRDSAKSSFGLDNDDFNLPCELNGPKNVKISDSTAKLERFAADIIGDGTEPGQLVIEGKLSQSETFYEWDSPFRVTYVMKLDDIPRDRFRDAGDPSKDEPGEWGSQTMAQLSQDSQAAKEAKESGALNQKDFEFEMARIKDAFANLPRTVGIQPTRVGAPEVDPDFDLTAAGYALVAAAVIGAIVVTVAVPMGAGLGIGALTELSAIGTMVIMAIIEYIGTVVVVDWYGEASASSRISDELSGKRDGKPVPARGIPIDVDLTRQRLAVFARPLPARLDVSCIKPDTIDDADLVLQMVGGEWPGDGKQWRISDSDGALWVRNETLQLFVAAAAAGGTEQPIGVSASSKGRLFLRTDPNSGLVDNLAGLPTCAPTPPD